MTLNEFVKKYNGKAIDFDKAYGAQCVDLFRQYCADVLEIGHTGSVDGAKDLFLKYDVLSKEKKAFCRIKEQLGAYYKQGDVLVWNATKTNPYGHVAIMICEMSGDFVVFEQNGMKQDGAKIGLRSRENLLGALRFFGDYKL